GGGIYVGGVGDLNVAGDVLRHGNARARTAYGAHVGRVDLDAAPTEELLYPAAYGGIQSASQESIGGGVGADGLLLLGIERLFLLGSAEGQERDHVGLGQRRLRAESGRELTYIAVQSDGHVIFLYPGGRVDVDKGLDHDGVGEEVLPVLQVVCGPGKVGGPVGDIDAAEDGGLRQGSTDAQIHAAGQLGVGIL